MLNWLFKVSERWDSKIRLRSCIICNEQSTTYELNNKKCEQQTYERHKENTYYMIIRSYWNKKKNIINRF